MTGVVELVLPYPISANRYWRSFVPKGHTRAIVVLSDEAKAYKTEVGWLCRQAGVREPIAVRSEVLIRIFPKRPQDWAKRAAKDPICWDDDVMSIDADNANKVLLDALKGIAIADDSRRYVRRLVTEQMEPDGAARVVVRLTPLVLPQHPQAALFAAAT